MVCVAVFICHPPWLPLETEIKHTSECGEKMGGVLGAGLHGEECNVFVKEVTVWLGN